MNAKGIFLTGLVTLAVQGNSGCVSNIPGAEYSNSIEQEVKLSPDSEGNLPFNVDDMDLKYAGKIVELDRNNYHDFISKGKRVVLECMRGEWGSEQLYPHFKEVASRNPSIGFGMIDVHAQFKFWREEERKMWDREKKIVSSFPNIWFYEDGRRIDIMENVQTNQWEIHTERLDAEVKRHYE